jgi:hypothetical protein
MTPSITQCSYLGSLQQPWWQPASEGSSWHLLSPSPSNPGLAAAGADRLSVCIRFSAPSQEAARTIWVLGGLEDESPQQNQVESFPWPVLAAKDLCLKINSDYEVCMWVTKWSAFRREENGYALVTAPFLRPQAGPGTKYTNSISRAPGMPALTTRSINPCNPTTNV